MLPIIISAMLLGDPLTIRAGARFGGAISSIVWRGQEYINRGDHGRELQMAMHFDGIGGECFNPTEAGSYQDDRSPTSTSVLRSGIQLGASTFSTDSLP